MAGTFALWAIFRCNQWSTNGPSKAVVICCAIYGKVHIKDPLMLMGKGSLYDDSEFRLKKYVRMTICLKTNSRGYENQYPLEASLNKTNFQNWLFISAKPLLFFHTIGN